MSESKVTGNTKVEDIVISGNSSGSSPGIMRQAVTGDLSYLAEEHHLSVPSQLLCPKCNQTINAHAHYCEHCGVDLGIAAAVAERHLLPFANVLPTAPISPEVLVPRMGDYLIDRGVLSAEDLQQALEYQRNEHAAGRSRLLGQALLELGLIDRETLDQVVTEQILELQSALQKANQTLERRVMERTAELRHALRRLGELNQLKSNFISNISHELRTPLTHIKGYLELLNEGELGALEAQQKKAIEVSLKSTSRLERLIEDLLQFSLAVRGELSLKLEYFQVEELFRRLYTTYWPKANSKNIHFSIELPDTSTVVKIDIEKVEWVVGQLVDNAFKFTPAGGRVILAAHVQTGLVTISVSDTGIGIPDGKINEIFQLFHQLDGSNTRRYEGVGLGLAFAQRIMETHGSQITVTSAVGQGSTFSFTLPAVNR